MNWYSQRNIVTKHSQLIQPQVDTSNTPNVEALQAQLPSGYLLSQKPNGMWIVTTNISGEEIELVHDEPTPEQAFRLAQLRIRLISAFNKSNIKFASHADLISYLLMY